MKRMTHGFLLLLILLPGITMSQIIPTYNLTVKNIRYPLPGFPNQMTFEIYLLHTNPQVTNFKFSAATQYSLSLNPFIANGGILIPNILASELPGFLIPPSVEIDGDILKFSTGLPNTDSFFVSYTSPGTLIMRLRIRTSASQFTPGEYPNLQWRSRPLPIPVTEIWAVLGVNHLDITTPETHTIDSLMTNINSSLQSPSKFFLSQNYPNPFNPNTNINYDLRVTNYVSLRVYDALGNEIATLVNEKQNAGSYNYQFSTVNYKLASGIYFYKLTAGDFEEVKRMMLIK